MRTSLIEHALRELELSGALARKPELAAAVLAAVGAIEGISLAGGVDPVDVAWPLMTLLKLETLCELTDDPGEWADRSGPLSRPAWQNLRNPKAFSQDAGKTFFLLHERQQYSPAPPPTYTSAPAATKRARR